LGKQQAIRLRAYLNKHKICFDKVYSSTALRATQTACIASSLPIVVRSDLEEMDQGDWEGEVRKDRYTDKVMKRVLAHPLTFKAPNGESKRTVAKRMDKAIEEIIEEYGVSHIGIVTHGIAIKCWLQKIMGFRPELIYSMAIDNCAINHVVRDGDWAISGINIRTW
jgi:probable phosphoglycerate mutase